MRTNIENFNNKFVCKMNCKKDHLLHNEINKNCYIKVLKRTKINDPLNSKYDEEIVIKFIVHKSYFLFFSQ